jgi:hypothetical protein
MQGGLQDEMVQLQAITADQSGINKTEAGNANILVSGWRPLIGWICGAALASQYILRPVIQWGFIVAHQPLPALPGIDDNLWQLLFAMLGMGGLRTFEKVKGVAPVAKS